MTKGTNIGEEGAEQERVLNLGWSKLLEKIVGSFSYGRYLGSVGHSLVRSPVSRSDA